MQMERLQLATGMLDQWHIIRKCGSTHPETQSCTIRWSFCEPVVVVKIWGPEKSGLVVVVEIRGGQDGGPEVVVAEALAARRRAVAVASTVAVPVVGNEQRQAQQFLVTSGLRILFFFNLQLATPNLFRSTVLNNFSSFFTSATCT